MTCDDLLRALVCLPLLALSCGDDASTASTTTTSTETGDSCPIGAEGCPCTDGGACDAGLVCLSNLCVDPASGSGSNSGTGDGDGDTSGDGDGDPTTGDGDGDPTTGDGDGDPTTTGDGDGDGMPGWDETYPSCEQLPDDACGGESCCTTDEVPGGWFAMGRGQLSPCPGDPAQGEDCGQTTATCQAGDATWGCPTGTWIPLGGLDLDMGQDPDELPEHAARVGFYGLDRFEVSVARMRAFIEVYDKDALLALLDGGAGAHPDLPGSGWQDSWDFRLPDSADELRAALQCDGSATWTDQPGANEDYPINCASWYLAYAFCAWDEGRLPSEAEWERAAIGGDENRLFPWGSQAPSAALANYNGSDNSTAVPVYAKPEGAGRYGHMSIAGSVWEWVMDFHDPDWYAGSGNDCQDCANINGDGAKVMRGGDWQYNAINLRGADRFPGTAGAYWLGSGIRCARD